MTHGTEVPTLAEIEAAKVAMDDINSFTYLPGDSFVDGEGTTRDTVNGRLKKMGYQVAIPYTGGIVFSVSDNTKTVEVGSAIYAPFSAALPFTTDSSFTNNSDKFFNVQLEFSADDGASRVGTESGSTVQAELDSLTTGQTGGIITFITKALLDAFTPSGSIEENTSYKVTNDPISSDNGYYHWNGFDFIKDADLVQNTIDKNNTSDGVSGKAVDSYTSNMIIDIITGESTIADGETEPNVDYEMSILIPVVPGEVINYTGVSSTSNPVQGFNPEKAWVEDLYIPPSSRFLSIEVAINIPDGVSYIRASSAFDNTAGGGFPVSPLIVESYIVSRVTATIDATIQLLNHLDRSIVTDIITGESTIADGETEPNVDYEMSILIPVVSGEVIKYTGVSSTSNPVQGFNPEKAWIEDLYLPPSVRFLSIDVAITIPEGVSYIRACSAFDNTAGSFPVSPLIVERNTEGAIDSNIEKTAELSQSVNIIPGLTNFRTMTYNIYEGGRDGTGRDAIFKHIARALPDVLTITEAGTPATLNVELEKLGFKYFYGPGGTFGLYFASKYPITHSVTLTGVDWNRNPLYTEVLINGKYIGIVSMHLDSGCVGLCHDSDFLNVVPQEPAAQRRSIQMYQIMDFLNDRKIANTDLSGFVVQGDYNAIDNEKNVLEHTTPLGDETLPSGLSYPLANEQFPTKQFEFYSGVMNLDVSPAVDGEIFTWWGEPESPNPVANNFEHRLDYISYSDDLIFMGAEILNSQSDNALPTSGRQKYGNPLNSDDGFIASDHLPVIMDLAII